MKDGLVRADTLPLVFRVPGTESLPRGARVRVRITGIDLLTLDLHAVLAARIDEAVPAGDDAEDADEETPATGPLTLAIDLNDGDAAVAPAPPPGHAAA